MATFNYARAKATAERLIKKFGQSATLRQSTQVDGSSDYDPEYEDTDHTCILAVLDYDIHKVDGTLIQSTDKQVYLSTEGLSVAPGEEDSLVINGDVFSIVQLKPLSPAGTVVFYEVQARG